MSRALGEPIGNSFAVDEQGGVYIVSDAALYRFEAARRRRSRRSGARRYANIGIAKPGQSEKGSGTTPTLMGKRLVSITDNADPMDVLVFKRARKVKGAAARVPPAGLRQGRVGHRPVADRRRARAMVVENNYGYTGPSSTMQGKTTTPGLARVNLKPQRPRLPRRLDVGRGRAVGGARSSRSARASSTRTRRAPIRTTRGT